VPGWLRWPGRRGRASERDHAQIKLGLEPRAAEPRPRGGVLPDLFAEAQNLSAVVVIRCLGWGPFTAAG
jgi:hypothetical protein